MLGSHLANGLASHPGGSRDTVEAPLMDTLLSGQRYLRPSTQNPDLFNSHTNSVFSHSRKRPALVTDTFFAPEGVRLRELRLYS